MTPVSGFAKVRRHSASASRKHARIWATSVSRPRSVNPARWIIHVSPRPSVNANVVKDTWIVEAVIFIVDFVFAREVVG